MQFSSSINLYDRILTREILHQSMWNWGLNFLSQLMSGSISWLQRSWLCGLSTSRRHDEKGTSAPTITYTLERGGGDSQIWSMREEKTREKKGLILHVYAEACNSRSISSPLRLLLDTFIFYNAGINLWCITYGSSCGLFPSELNQLTLSVSADGQVYSSNLERTVDPQKL